MVDTTQVRSAAHAVAVDSAYLKVRILADGLQVSDEAAAFLAAHGKRRLRVRSGSCGGVDLILPGGVYVNCPVDEEFATRSGFELQLFGDTLRLHDSRDGSCTPVTALPEPRYYAGTSGSGTPWRQVGQVCSDRLGIGLTNACVYWASAERRCKFCSIGLNVGTGHEVGRKLLDDIVAVTGLAVVDPVLPARHVLLGGGTPVGPDAGAIAIAAAAREIKRRWPEISVYAMVAPPQRVEFVDLLVDSGVDELGINVELFSAEAARAFAPGKHALGMDYFITGLAHAVAAYAMRAGELPTYRPSVGRVRSITVVGLEPEEETLRGVEMLCRTGVMPILTPFRPMRGTEMEFHPRWAGERLWDLAKAATEVAGRFGMPLGPTCIPCQANTLNVPGHLAYRNY